MKTVSKNPLEKQGNTTELIESLINLIDNIQWYGQSAIRIPFNHKVFYIDPFQITDRDPAEFILITHPHFDHFSIKEINKIAGHNTPIFAPEECCETLRTNGFTNCTAVVPGQTFTVQDIAIETVPAYNTIKQNHPKSSNWVGYVLTIGPIKIYHPGDTNRIPEMKSIRCDISFMPLGQTYTMHNVQEAADAILDVKAKIAIPIHYGIYEGAPENAILFKQILDSKVKTIIKESKTRLQPIL